MSIWRTLRAVVLLPVTMTVLVPLFLLSSNGIHVPGWSPPWLTWTARAVGLALALGGIALLAWTVALFHRIGRGSLAPFDPPTRLVVRGPYRYVRNPMITGVCAILVGEALTFTSAALLTWAAAFLVVNALWFPLVEEPGLAERFGADYDEYRRHVPRWLPRLRAWTQPVG
jgi:protein-S-isoprenylcysteine O-methyltransferase Ste14